MKSTLPSQSSELKKTRMAFTPHQLYMLEEYFESNQFPKAKEREEIASKLNIAQQNVRVCIIKACNNY